MKLAKTVLCFTTILFTMYGCKKKSSNPELASLNLLRGELVLCSADTFGEVNFALSCNYETRETFDLAVSLLHSFEYAEAEKAFVQVIDMDPDCAMAYWGVSMSIFHSLWMQSDLSYLEKGKKLIKIAQELSLNEREKDYLDAISVFYKDWELIDQNTRKELYEAKMEYLYNKYKDDTEAAVFYALAIRSAADPTDKTYIKQKKSGKILEDLFIEQPNHPGIAHYIIHNYDYPELAKLALSTARRYADIAPASAHAQHMPSHIFTRLGLWEESIESNIKSTESALCYAESIRPLAHWDEELHGMDYLVYAYLQIGDNKKANEQYEYLNTFHTVFPTNFKIAYSASAIPTRIALENKNWISATKLQLPPLDIDWNKFPWQKAMLHFGKALGFLHTNNIEDAENELKILQTLHDTLSNENDIYKSGQVMIQITTVNAWIELAKRNNDKALVLMKKAVELESQTSKHAVTPGEVVPAAELLGDMLLELNKPHEALIAYETNLKNHPNRFNGIYGAAISAKESGDHEKAAIYFKQLLELTENSNSNRPEIKEAKDFIETL